MSGEGTEYGTYGLSSERSRKVQGRRHVTGRITEGVPVQNSQPQVKRLMTVSEKDFLTADC